MNPEKFTHKTNEALAAAEELASRSSHAQCTPVHLALALTKDTAGLLCQAISSAGGGDEAVKRVLSQSLKKISSQHPPPEDVTPNTALSKCMRRAQSAQKKKRNIHLAVDHLILGLLEDSKVADYLKEASVNVVRAKSQLEKLRGEGQEVKSASGDTNFQALRTYGRDLVEDAGKLDPVIGRDEEIRRVVTILYRRTKNNPVLIRVGCSKNCCG
eukprot:Gb_21333 [translate_table: standard]